MNDSRSQSASADTHLLIMRHGTAAAYARTDAERPLTEAGRGEASAVGRFLVSDGLLEPTVYHSPYARARQTASIVLEYTGSSRCVESSELTPDSEPRLAADVVQAEVRDLSLCVAHLPLVARLLGWLVDGDTRSGPVFAPGAVALIRWEFAGPGGGRLQWYREPRELR